MQNRPPTPVTPGGLAALAILCATVVAYEWRITPTPNRKNAQWALIGLLLAGAFAAALQAAVLW